jgi:hypothetical protein
MGALAGGAAAPAPAAATNEEHSGGGAGTNEQGPQTVECCGDNRSRICIGAVGCGDECSGLAFEQQCGLGVWLIN